ncbi:MAG TPA: hypothetical protein VFB38_19790 [Chthonomonadaceae bacterium]|nr:hypothetical protein [Chthonomonadaceae bacterium]
MRTKFFRLGIVPTCILLLCIALPAFALWVQIPVTANGIYDGQRFTIKVTDHEQFKQFQITLAPASKEVSPFLNGTLSLIAQDQWVASVPVAEHREKGIVTYTFRVVPGALAQSSFEISASAFAPARGGPSPFGTAMLGKRKVEQLMGGTIFTIKLSDFATQKNLGSNCPLFPGKAGKKGSVAVQGRVRTKLASSLASK